MKNEKEISYMPFMVVYVSAAVIFMIVKIFVPDFTASFVIKVIPALTLAAAICFTGRLALSQKIAMLAGALFCGAGDVILDIDRVRLFVPGLAAFLLGHVGFIILFWMRRVSKSPRRIWIIPVLLFSLAMAFVLVPKLGSLLVPVMLYLVVITLMTMLAIVADVRPLAAVGAFVFMLSDAMIALAKFVFNGHPSPLFTIPVYFTGLFLLGFGILLSVRSK
ncbi:MAG TPA: lysoplasmalogenase [Smithellaceae bacterium]|nr:lysoplasmalogenase [Smithellaceae bacterium]HRS89482.1 lysoplasmalogenase [Smithellaceae bacterium]HRV26431.1 lysoplasmalogenase [Smithellaceae bacterium]